MITDPGIYDGLDDAVYHADPVEGGSLSSSGARRLLDCPAKFHHERTVGREPKAEFDFGHAAHTHVLGTGAPVDVLDFDDWRTKAAQAARADAQLDGRTPILAKDWAVVEAMAEQLRAHPIASRLLHPDSGSAEQSLFWRDMATGVMLRARLDWLPNLPVDPGRRLIVPDYKTARSAERHDFARSAADYGYHAQAAWYLAGVSALLPLRVEPAFVFIVQEKTAPYVVNVIELDDEALQIGADRNRRAIDLYVQCTTTGVWPGYSTRIETASLPRYSIIQHEEEFSLSW